MGPVAASTRLWSRPCWCRRRWRRTPAPRAGDRRRRDAGAGPFRSLRGTDRPSLFVIHVRHPWAVRDMWRNGLSERSTGRYIGVVRAPTGEADWPFLVGILRRPVYREVSVDRRPTLMEPDGFGAEVVSHVPNPGPSGHGLHGSDSDGARACDGCADERGCGTSSATRTALRRGFAEGGRLGADGLGGVATPGGLDGFEACPVAGHLGGVGGAGAVLRTEDSSAVRGVCGCRGGLRGSRADRGGEPPVQAQRRTAKMKEKDSDRLEAA